MRRNDKSFYALSFSQKIQEKREHLQYSIASKHKRLHKNLNTSNIWVRSKYKTPCSYTNFWRNTKKHAKQPLHDGTAAACSSNDCAPSSTKLASRYHIFISFSHVASLQMYENEFVKVINLQNIK